MERILIAYRADENITEEIAKEIPVLFPEITGIAARQIVLRYPTSTRADTVTIVLCDSKQLTSPRENSSNNGFVPGCIEIISA